MTIKNKIILTIVVFLVVVTTVVTGLESLGPAELRPSMYINKSNSQNKDNKNSSKTNTTNDSSTNNTGSQKANASTSLVAVRSSSCKKEYDEQTSNKNGEKVNESVIDLDQLYDFVLVNCTQSAYQGIYNLNIKNKKSGIYTLLELETYNSDSKELSKSTDFCQRTGVIKNDKYLEIVCHSRGLGDCGTQDLYKWIPDQLYIRLARAREQKACLFDIIENQKLNESEQKKLISKPFPIIYENNSFL